MILTQLFRTCLKDSQRLVILGVGSVLKADDAAGAEIAMQLMKKYPQSCSASLCILNGSTAPENYTGVIKNFAPDHILIVDAADTGEEPGTVSVIHPDSISNNSFSTHMLPLSFMSDYLQQETGCAVTMIGIQPADLTFGAPMTLLMRTAVLRVKKALETLLRERFLHP